MARARFIFGLVLITAAAARADLYFDSGQASLMACPNRLRQVEPASTPCASSFDFSRSEPHSTNYLPAALLPDPIILSLCPNLGPEDVDASSGSAPQLEVTEFPPPPSSTSLLLSAFLGLGAWHVARTARTISRPDVFALHDQPVATVNFAFHQHGTCDPSNCFQSLPTASFDRVDSDIPIIIRQAHASVHTARAPPRHSFCTSLVFA